jgi:hypothetical protein
MPVDLSMPCFALVAWIVGVALVAQKLARSRAGREARASDSPRLEPAPDAATTSAPRHHHPPAAGKSTAELLPFSFFLLPCVP